MPRHTFALIVLSFCSHSAKPPCRHPSIRTLMCAPQPSQERSSSTWGEFGSPAWKQIRKIISRLLPRRFESDLARSFLQHSIALLSLRASEPACMCREGYSAVGVPQRFLNDFHVLAIRLQGGCIAMPKCMPTNRLLNAASISRRTDVTAQDVLWSVRLFALHFRARKFSSPANSLSVEFQ